MIPFPFESVRNICDEDINPKYIPFNNVKDRLSELAMENANNFRGNRFDFYTYLINLLLKKNKYHKSFPYEEYENKCIIIFNAINSLLHNKNYFKQDENELIFYYNQFAFNISKSIFYKPIIRKMLIIDYNVPSNKVDSYVNSIITVIFCMLGNIQYFKRTLDLDENYVSTHDMRKMTAAEKFQVKCLILDYLKSGLFSQKEITKILIINAKTVRRIQRMLAANHFLTYEDLIEKKHGPAANPFKTISKEACEALKSALKHLPKQYGLPYAGWGTKAIKMFLYKHYSTEVSENYLRYFLRKNNYTSKVGQRKNPKQNEEKVNAFLTEDYEKELVKAKQNNERVVFADEMHVQQGHGNRSYAHRGERAVTSYHQTAKHTNYSLLTFIGFDGLFSIHMIAGTVDTGWFIYYLKELKRNNKNDKFLVFIDNCSIHNSQELNDWLNRKNGGKNCIRVAYFPAYSPELNPVEYFNNDFHGHLETIALDNAQAVVDEAYSYIAWYLDNADDAAKEKVKAFFYAPKCRYTIEIYNKVQQVHNND